MSTLRIVAAIAATALIIVCFLTASRDIRRPGGPTTAVFIGTCVTAGVGCGYLLRFAFTGAFS